MAFAHVDRLVSRVDGESGLPIDACGRDCSWFPWSRSRGTPKIRPTEISPKQMSRRSLRRSGGPIAGLARHELAIRTLAFTSSGVGEMAVDIVAEFDGEDLAEIERKIVKAASGCSSGLGASSCCNPS